MHQKSNFLQRFKFLRFVLIAGLFILSNTANAQFWKKVKKAAERGAERGVIRKTEEKSRETTEEVIEDVINGKKSEQDQEELPSTNEESPTETSETTTDQNEQEDLWVEYNFVPGDEIIFYDGLEYELSGEFPSRWDLIKGNAENASLNSTNIINLSRQSIITPLFNIDNYLPEQFTIEFDAYFNGDPGPYSWQHYDIRFAQSSGGWYYPITDSEDYYYPLTIYRHGAELSASINGNKRNFATYEESLKQPEPVWRHIALAFNKRSLKVFVDQYQVLNIPNLGFQPKLLSIGADSYTEENYIRAIQNIRIAKGGSDLYERIIEDGKFVTRGILFDVNQATLKPESMGVINEVAKLMQQHQDLAFLIEGHTDSDGSDEHNLQLSEKRANAVKEILLQLGIAEQRITTQGKGESEPITDNSTAEAKANNRRVEFIKMKN